MLYDDKVPGAVRLSFQVPLELKMGQCVTTRKKSRSSKISVLSVDKLSSFHSGSDPPRAQGALICHN
jgi:hypothetical protein